MMATTKTPDIPTLRVRITAVRAEMAQVAQAPVPLADASANVDTFLATLATGYRPPLGMVFAAHDAQPGLDIAPLVLGDPRDAYAGWMFQAATQGDVLRKLWGERLRQAYETDPSLAHPMTADDRASRLADLQRQLVDLELAEEAAIVQRELRGEQVDRRGDVSPAVLFDERMLRLEAPPAA
jgi:hypothetical protein